MLRSFVVGFYFESLELYVLSAENEYEAVKRALIEACTDEESKQSEKDFQDSEDFPQDYDDLVIYLNDADMEVNIIEI